MSAATGKGFPMSDLEYLARASHHPPANQYHRPPPRRQKSGGGKWIAICAGGAVLLIGIIVVAARGLRSPGFTVDLRRNDSAVNGWITITNQRDSALRVDRVRINGEYDCSLGREVGDSRFSVCLPNDRQSLPAEATVGDSVSVVQFAMVPKKTPPKDGLAYMTEGTHDFAGYRKDVVYIDIETNRGTFRYRPGEGFD